MTPRMRCDLAIIGAGPAGLAAATQAAALGVDAILFDEQPAPGGQIYRGIETVQQTRRDDLAILGEEYAEGTLLAEAFRASGAAYEPGSIVWQALEDGRIGVSRGGTARIVAAQRILIASGAIERPVPIPGWTLPGVMTVGAAQTLLKSSGLVPDGRVVFAGTGPLLWLFAAQMLRAGGTIDAILDTTPRGNYLRALPHALSFAFSPYMSKGLALTREVKRKIRVITGVTALSAAGDDKLSSIAVKTGNNKEKRIAVDTLLLHQGVVPNVNLAMAAGIAHRWDDRQLCWTPILDADGNTSVNGIVIAGDGGGIGGAFAAAERGRLAGIAAVETLAPQTASRLPNRSSTQHALRRAQAGRAFLDILFQPAPTFRLPAGDTIVCRCEEVTAAQIAETMSLSVEGPNQLKAFLRCGMGPCQGRLCGLTVTELIARARGVSPDFVGYYRLRPPVKPIALKELAAMPQTEPAVNAVVRG